MRHIVSKLSTRATTLLQTSLQSEVYKRSYAPTKSQESQLWEFRDSHENLGTKTHLDVALVEMRKVYYKGEGGGFPQVWAVVSLVNSRLLVVRPSTKSVPTMH
jgi:hypothetical protein